MGGKTWFLNLCVALSWAWLAGCIGDLASNGLNDAEAELRGSASCSVNPDPVLLGDGYELSATRLVRGAEVEVVVDDASGMSSSHTVRTGTDRSLSMDGVGQTLGESVVSIFTADRNPKLLTRCSFQVVEECQPIDCASAPDNCGMVPDGCGGELDCGACSSSCGDGVCDSDESCADCAEDCGSCPSTCGDGVCDSDETCGDCAEDCGSCPSMCGDGVCDSDETCNDCASDCGSCGTGRSGTTYYVDRNHVSASDGNSGDDESRPWRTIVHAATVVGPGDTVYVKQGVYRDGEIRLGHSGERGQEVIIAAYPGHERMAIVEGDGFLSVGKSHVVLRDLTFKHTPRSGIRFEGPPDASDPPAENISIIGNYTHDTYSSGISIWGVRWRTDPGDYDNIRDVVIEGNLLELGTNGGKNEIITVANGAVNVDVRFNEIRMGDPAMTGGDEGVDFKEGVRDSRIYGNLIHDLSDKAIYLDGGSDPRDPKVTNIEIFDNIMWNLPSAGISITTEGLGDVDGVLVYNNVVYNVDGDGYLVYNHPGGAEEGGTVKNVIFVNNTVFNAGLRHGGHGGFRVNHSSATGIIIQNNIAWGNNGFDIRGEAETTIDHNLCRESHCEVRSDPRFVDASNGNFELMSTSPAIDMGVMNLAPSVDVNGVSRPLGASVDLGAFEFQP